MSSAPITANCRTADLPLSERRVLDADRQRELVEGLARRNLRVATERAAYDAFQFNLALRVGPALRAALARDKLGR